MKRAYWMRQSRQENLIYIAVWVALFASPLLSMYAHTVNCPEHAFDWTEVVFLWRRFGVYLLCFLIHNFMLAPLLVHSHRRGLYFATAALMLASFTAYQCSHHPGFSTPPHGHHGPAAIGDGRPLPPDGGMADDMGRPPLKPERQPLPPQGDPRSGVSSLQDGRSTGAPLVGEPDIMAIAMLVLMLAANVGIKGYFRSREDRRRLAELEKHDLEQQLTYLRYQINPHFFMNTLNNIHALIDIDPEQAQATVVELSKMMRFVLYECDRRYVALAKELEFIRTYVGLMRLRYTDKVSITLELPTDAGDRSLPPLILISFIENAFKHGVSYQHPSFIDVKVSVEGEQLRFTCRNSKGSAPAGGHGGVGLANVRRRLDLLYPGRYELAISDEATTYGVELVMPLETANQPPSAT